MTITVSSSRLSFVWTETLAAEMAAAGDAAPMAFLHRRSTYEKAFEEALKETDASAAAPAGLRLTPPWRDDSRQRYWSYYAENTQSDRIRAQQVWRLLIPLRVSSRLVDIAPPAGLRVTQEGFLSPFGTAFVLGLRFDEELPLDKALDRVISARYERVFDAGAAGAKLTLSEVAERGLAAMRTAALGPGAVAPANHGEPFSIASIVEAEGEGLFAPLAENPELHKALDGLARLSRSWRIDTPKALASSLIAHESTRPEEHCTLAARTGRTIWQPRYFDDPDDGPTMLSCYHRNVMFASLQVMSLLGLVAYAKKTSDAGAPAAGPIEDCIRNAAGLLGRIYGGDSSTYRTDSARRQIDDSSARSAVDKVRKDRGMAALARP